MSWERPSRNDQRVDSDALLADQEWIDVDRLNKITGRGDDILQRGEGADRFGKHVIVAFQSGKKPADLGRCEPAADLLFR